MIEHVINSIEKAELNISKIDLDILNIRGMSGVKTRHFYNNLLEMQDARYLEIGTWGGSSVCSAMYKNNAKVICIDNWSLFGGPKEEFLKNFNKFKGNNSAIFIENDCFNIDISLLPKFNIYLYDGDHSERSHYLALTHFINSMEETFVFIVDDWNWQDVRNGTNNSIKDLNLKILFVKEILLTDDNSHTPMQIAHQSWWNGIAIFVLQK